MANYHNHHTKLSVTLSDLTFSIMTLLHEVLVSFGVHIFKVVTVKFRKSLTSAPEMAFSFSF
jgi:hypothetical protein